MNSTGELRLLGVVFAGGRSSRMGRPKALLPWPDPSSADREPLFVHAARVLGPICSTVEIAAGDDRESLRAASSEWEMFADAVRGAGPLGALVAALERAVALGLDGVVALACDMPFVTPAELEPLVAAAREGADAALWEIDGLDQPLCAVYRVTCAAPARDALARGARRLVAAFEASATSDRQILVHRVAAGENSRLRLMNVNTPSDYDSARNRSHDAERRTARGPRRPDRR